MAALGAPARHTIRGGGYEAEVDEVGATLACLRFAGRDLVLPTPRGELPVGFAGAVLAPWPNRLRDGRYLAGGVVCQAPITEPERGTALHGLVVWLRWAPVAPAADDTVALGTVLPRQPGYPSDLALVARYSAGPGGLSTTVTATNLGSRPAPYGVGGHPYLVAGPGLVDDWTLQLPVASVAGVDDRRLPTGEVRPVADAGLDFRRPRRIGGTRVDDAFTHPDADAGGLVAVRLTGPDDRGVELVAAASWARWWQVFTADAMPTGPSRTGLAVEPMSCPPDAFSSGSDVVTLAPGDSHEASWTIRAVG